MNDKWVEFAIRIQSIAQSGLQYGKDKYDRERYEELRQIAAEMLSLKTDIPVNKILKFYLPEYPFSETTFLLQSVSIPHNALCHIYLSRTEAQTEQYFEYELQTQPIYHSYSLSPLQIPIY